APDHAAEGAQHERDREAEHGAQRAEVAGEEGGGEIGRGGGVHAVVEPLGRVAHRRGGHRPADPLRLLVAGPAAAAVTRVVAPVCDLPVARHPGHSHVSSPVRGPPVTSTPRSPRPPTPIPPPTRARRKPFPGSTQVKRRATHSPDRRIPAYQATTRKL